MAHNRHFNSGKQLANTEVTPQEVWPIAKSLINRDGPRAPTAIHGLLSLKFHLLDTANAIAVWKSIRT
jgi:hypothetical protein